MPEIPCKIFVYSYMCDIRGLMGANTHAGADTGVGITGSDAHSALN